MGVCVLCEIGLPAGGTRVEACEGEGAEGGSLREEHFRKKEPEGITILVYRFCVKHVIWLY